MKHLALALLMATGCAPVLAGPCVALDYQEMKEMSADELLRETCKATKISMDNLDYSIATPSLSKASLDAMRDHEQCAGQVDRMQRLLKSKGVDGKLYELCAQQAKGQTIQPAEEAK